MKDAALKQCYGDECLPLFELVRSAGAGGRGIGMAVECVFFDCATSVAGDVSWCYAAVSVLYLETLTVQGTIQPDAWWKKGLE
jgi:hypothetical protein